MAALHGYLDIEEMKAQLSQRAYLGWQRYWDAEPWGPWRDNMHTALLAREIRRPQLRRGRTIDLDDFMVRSVEDRAESKMQKAEQEKGNFFAFLKTVAKKVRSGDTK